MTDHDEPTPGPALDAARARLDGEEPPVPDFAELAARLDAETGPVAWLRSRSSRERFGLLLGGFAALTVALGAGFGWADGAALRRPGILLELALLGGFLLLAAAAALRGYQHAAMPRWLGWVLVGGTVGVPVGMALAPLLSGVRGEPPPLSAALGCLGYGLCIAAPVMAAAWVLDRGAWRGSPQIRYAGMAAGLAGLVGLQLHCPVHDPSHLAFGHLPVVIAMLATAAAVRLLLRR